MSLPIGSERFLDFSGRALRDFVVDACVVGVNLALSRSDTHPVAQGRRLLDDSETEPVTPAGYDIDALHLFGGVVLVPASEALRFMLEAIVGVEDSCVATRHKEREGASQ